ncbi:hypothetical protein ACUXZZ_22895 [Streptomyces graminifolii]|uniref:hypothetical protein n=1 Tax=Streptomyces graminifolii TaxID=1266771 RepID=UPI004059DD60
MTRIGVTGHQNLPAKAIPYIREELHKILSSMGEGQLIEALTSLAAGADQLFAQIALSCSASLRVVVPSEDYADTFQTARERQRFIELKNSASRCVKIGHTNASEQAFFDAGVYIADNSDLLIAVWDGRPARGFGGTADIVNYANSKGVPVTIVWKEGVTRD